MTPANQIARLEYVVREQMKEIDQLRAENQALVDWIMGDADALTCLQTIYHSSTASEANKVRAAAAAIGYERPKMTPTNLVGNAVATIVIARWENALDTERMARVLDGELPAES